MFIEELPVTVKEDAVTELMEADVRDTLLDIVMVSFMRSGWIELTCKMPLTERLDMETEPEEVTLRVPEPAENDVTEVGPFSKILPWRNSVDVD